MRHFTKHAISIFLALIFCICSLAGCDLSGTSSNASSIASDNSSAGETDSTADTVFADGASSGEAVDSAADGEGESTTQSNDKTAANTPAKPSENENQTSSCSHTATKTVNKINATTTSEGYTGDIYCKDCNTKISSGTTIPKIEDNTSGKYKYTLPDGTVVYANSDKELTEITMANATKQVNHQFPEVEQEILRLCNEERAKVGLSPLQWYEDAYYFTKIRAEESLVLFSHTRPNGKSWKTVYTDANVALNIAGENLFLTEGYTIEGYAKYAVDGWMNSPGHRANILNPNYTQLSIAIVQNGTTIVAAQNFFE